MVQRSTTPFDVPRRPVVEGLESRLLLSGTPSTISSTTSVAGINQTSGVLSEAREEIGAVTVGSLAMFAGGFTGLGTQPSEVVDIFNSATGERSVNHLSEARSQIAAASVGDLAFFAGGLIGIDTVGLPAPITTLSNVVDIYNARTGVWTTATLSVARFGISVVTVGDTVIFAGGYTGQTAEGSSLIPSDAVDIYNAGTGKWSATTLSQARDYISAVAVGDLAMFAGGVNFALNGAATPSDAVDIYDAANGQWTTAKLSQARYDIGAISVGNLAFFAGGNAEGTSGVPVSNRVDIYDASTGQWSTATLSDSRENVAAVAVGSLAIFAGGDNGLLGGEPTGAVDIYNTVTKSWSVSTLPEAASSMSGEAIGSDAIFAGDTSTGNLSSGTDAYVFDAATGAWSTTPLSAQHNAVAAVTVASTSVFAGGDSISLSSTSDAVDIFSTPGVQGIIAAGGRGSLHVTIENTGGVALSQGDTVWIYASTSASNRGAVLLGSVMLSESLAIGASTVVSAPVSLPSDLAAGNYHLLALIASPARVHGTIFATYADVFSIAGADVAASGLPRGESANRAGLPFSVTPIADGGDTTVSELASAGANILE